MSNPFTIVGQMPLPNTVVTVDEAPVVAVLQTNRDLDITKHFPFPTIREAQSTALATVVESRQKQKKFTLIEAPTGVGKSGIAMATASWMDDGQACGVNQLLNGGLLELHAPLPCLDVASLSGFDDFKVAHCFPAIFWQFLENSSVFSES